MSSTLPRVYVTALALAAAVAACSATVSSESSAPPKAADDSAMGEGPPAYVASDASASSERSLLASPLCGFTDKSCFPDDDGTLPLAASAGEHCADADAGVDDASVNTGACRVRKSSANPGDEKDGVATYVPQCTSANSAGTDGVACTGSADCASGFDCVAGEKGAVCRRYCCTGSCEEHTSANAGPTFCDIQKPVDLSEHKVPVCMPLKSCKLFAVGECGQDETCAIVTGTGATGCITKGNAKVGEPCDADHCEGGLTCLGSPGDRRCYKLCRIDGKDCAETESCTPGSIFHDMAFGVCQGY